MINHPDKNEGHSHDIFSNPEILVSKFDAPERDEWQKPDEVIASFNLPQDAVVVEVGASTGYFAVRIAPHIPNGKVIGFEPSPVMADYLQKRAVELGLTNIDARTTEPDGGIKLDEKANLIFSVDVYHHLKDRVAYFRNVARYLKPEGVLVVIDRTEEKIAGQPMGHRVPKDQIKTEMKEAGFELVNDFNFLLPVQHYLAFKRCL
jgi:cyclopropane fatty-acyl-phospholipid synthase-like methyltransferase